MMTTLAADPALLGSVQKTLLLPLWGERSK